MTEDISYSGLFVRTDETSLRGEVIGLRIKIPDHGQTLSLHAMVAHCISWDHAARWQQGPGWGLQLQGIQGESLKAWNGFVARVIALHDARSLDGNFVGRTTSKERD